MKKDIPLIVHKALEKYVGLEGENFKILERDNFLMKVIDSDKLSNFYFNVISYKTEGGFKFLIDRKPQNQHSVNNMELWIEARSLDNYFNSWLELISGYNKTRTFFDDPIIDAFTDEYYAEFELIDDDADVPLKPKQILLLDEHLEYIQENIEKHQTESNKDKIAEIKNDIIELRENLTSNSKEKVVRNLSKIWAKLTKLGTKFMKEFLTETRKEGIKQVVKLAVTEGLKHIGNLGG